MRETGATALCDFDKFNSNSREVHANVLHVASVFGVVFALYHFLVDSVVDDDDLDLLKLENFAQNAAKMSFLSHE